MKHILIATLFYFTAISNIAYAETPKSAKTLKSSDHNKSDEEWLKEFMQLQQELKEEKAKTKAIEEEGKKLDEINKLLGVDSKKK